MLLCALVRHPLPEDVADNVAEFARELGVEEGMVDVPASSRPARSVWRPTTSPGTATREPGTRRSRRRRCTRAGSSTMPGSSRSTTPSWRHAGRRSSTCPGTPSGARCGRCTRPAGSPSRVRRLRAPVARPTRLGARVGGLRHDRGVRGRGVRPDRPRQRRHARVLVAGHGHRLVRDRLPRHGRGTVRDRRRGTSRRARTWRSASPTPWRGVPAATTRRPAPTASTSSGWTGSRWRTAPVTTSGSASICSRSRRTRRSGIGRPLEPGRDQPVPGAGRPRPGGVAWAALRRPRRVSLRIRTRGSAGRPARDGGRSPRPADRAWRRCWRRASRRPPR